MKTIFVLGVVLFLSLPVAFQKAEQPSVQSVVDTERAFARTSAAKGTRSAFLDFIAEDGILFRPAAVNGKKWLLEHPSSTSSDKRPLLAWQPVFADISLAGDLGFTLGPWEFKQDIKDAKPVAYGHFATVWKKQADDSWKFVIDHGISHPEPQGPLTPWHLPPNYKQKPWKPMKFEIEVARTNLMNRDREFSNTSSKQGIAKAFSEYSLDDVRLFRNDSYPFVGKEAAVIGLSSKTPTNIVMTWQPLAGDVSRSDDLGYTYGTYALTSIEAPNKIKERGNYVRFWKKHNGVWKVLLEVADPLPPDAKD
jgi:ketosteroid isomerase-like protein